MKCGVFSHSDQGVVSVFSQLLTCQMRKQMERQLAAKVQLAKSETRTDMQTLIIMVFNVPPS